MSDESLIRKQTSSPIRRWIEGRNIVSAVCILAIIGAAIWSVVAPDPTDPTLDAAVGTKVSIEGVIVVDPDVRAKTQFLDVNVGRKYLIQVQTDNYQTYIYGERIRASGELELPAPFTTDTGRIFNYPKYLLAHHITHTMSFAQVRVLSDNEGNRGVAMLLDVKHLLMRGIESALPDPESALLEGLLLGNKQSLGDSITESFRRAGVVHMIVLSGYNVSVVITAILFVAMYFLPRLVALSVAGVGIVLFAIMTGVSETTLRASVMAGIALVAMALHRPNLGIRALLMTTAVLSVWNPYLVLYDLSFELSVLSTAGLMLFSEPLMPYLGWMTEQFGMRSTLATTLATQLTVTPLLIYSVGQISIVSVATNLLVLWAVPYAMLAGFIASLVAFASPTLAFPFSAVSYALLTYIIHVSVFMGSLPFAAIQI